MTTGLCSSEELIAADFQKWQDFKFLSAPISSVASEREFKIAHDLTNGNRNRLRLRNVQRLLFLKQNLKVNGYNIASLPGFSNEPEQHQEQSEEENCSSECDLWRTSMKLCRWSSSDLNRLFLCFLWSCCSNFLLYISILLVMHNSSFLPELLGLFLWWHNYIKIMENSCIPYCWYGWNTTHACSLSTPWGKQRKCWCNVRSCMQNLPPIKILPRSDHYPQVPWLVVGWYQAR